MRLSLNLTLTQRLWLAFSMLLLACCGASAWLQIRASDMHQEEVIQGLSRGLAGQIALNALLSNPDGLKPAAVRPFFGQLMNVNPSVEVYLLDHTGRVVGQDAPAGHLRRERVDLAPVQRFLDGAPLPILGDDPRSLDGRKVFSAAPLRMANAVPAGYIYVVLLGEAHDRLAARVSANEILRTSLWWLGLVALLGLLAGLAAFGLITRPLRRLTETVRHFDANGDPAAQPRVAHPPSSNPQDDIALLEGAFGQMAERIGEQWRALTQQDRERRELVANISHDLRTPLTSLHGYLEMLALKADTLSDDERKRYLGIALAQSVKVGRLAQALFELARLEHGLVQPERESFALADLLQDVFEKFELAAQARHLDLRAVIPARLPNVDADLQMIERVLTNLLDNAIRHTPDGGSIEVRLEHGAGQVVVTLSDTGPGIPVELRARLFQRPFSLDGAQRGGGLGLLIVQRMLQLHGSQIVLLAHPGSGATFRFALPQAYAPAAGASSTCSTRS